MITEHDLREAIAECEGKRNPTADTCIKLAAFYTILREMYPVPQEPAVQEPVVMRYSGAARYTSDTEFGQLVEKLPPEQIMPVMDELMSTLQVLQPRLYAGVLRKLEN